MDDAANGGFTKGVIYTLDTVLLHALPSRKKMGVGYIMLSCPNQHKAIGNSFNGVSIDPDMERSQWLRTMCDGNRLHLTESMRSGEGVLWDFYSSVAIGGSRFHWTLGDQIDLARSLFPFKKPTQFNLTVSHKTRLRLNREYNDREAKGKEKVFVEKSEKASW